MNTKKVVVLSALISAIIFFPAGIYLEKYFNMRKETRANIVREIAFHNQRDSERDELNRKISTNKSLYCNQESAEAGFRRQMNFKFPDWPIIGKPVIEESGDCSYLIRFTTINPHLLPYITKHEVIVVQLLYTEDYSGFSMQVRRGVLY